MTVSDNLEEGLERDVAFHDQDVGSVGERAGCLKLTGGASLLLLSK